jgi:hypothetical protein
MAWPVNSLTDEARVKWNTAMKFLIPAKFDVTRAIELYRTHEVSVNDLMEIFNCFTLESS